MQKLLSQNVVVIIELIFYTGLWTNHIFDTTYVMYKEVLNLWFKGTGGGVGLRPCSKDGVIQSSNILISIPIPMITRI